MSSDDDHDSASDGSEDSSGGSGSAAESGSGGDDDSGSDAEKSSKLSPEQLAKSVAAVFGTGEAMRVTLAAVLDKLRSEELKLFAPDRSASRQPPSETSVRFEPKSSRSLAAPRLAEVPSAVDIGIQAGGEEKQTEMRHGRHCQHCGRHRSRSRSTDGIHDGRCVCELLSHESGLDLSCRMACCCCLQAGWRNSGL
jgi:hypothetical protein